jgi:predicted sulfurtransferase
MLERHRKFLEDKDVRGRIYIARHGINCQAGGAAGDARAYVEWVAAQPEFQGVYHTLWPAPGHVHPKLRIKERAGLISLAGGVDGLGVTDPNARATPLDPAAWREMLRRANAATRASAEAAAAAQQAQQQQPEQQQQQQQPPIVVLDVRNDYEWDAGHFQGAARPAEEEFSDTPVGDGDGDVPEPLKGHPKDAPVMMYCTGGIRCDIYSAFLRKRGYTQLYTLEGGIQNYLKATPGGEGWDGSLFVFDGRLAINPALPGGETGAADLPAAVPCQLCREAPARLPHINCANIDCNELFLACAACADRYQGCCCAGCMSAPRLLRPIKLDGGNWERWTSYGGASFIVDCCALCYVLL